MPQTEGPRCLLRLRVPGDPGLVEMVRDLAGCVVERERSSAGQIDRIRQAVAAALQAIAPSADDDRGIELELHAWGLTLEVVIRGVEASGEEQGLADGADRWRAVQRHALSLPGRVDVSRAGGMVVCRLFCELPPG